MVHAIVERVPCISAHVVLVDLSGPQFVIDICVRPIVLSVYGSVLIHVSRFILSLEVQLLMIHNHIVQSQVTRFSHDWLCEAGVVIYPVVFHNGLEH